MQIRFAETPWDDQLYMQIFTEPFRGYNAIMPTLTERYEISHRLKQWLISKNDNQPTNATILQPR